MKDWKTEFRKLAYFTDYKSEMNEDHWEIPTFEAFIEKTLQAQAKEMCQYMQYDVHGKLKMSCPDCGGDWESAESIIQKYLFQDQ